MDKYCTNVSNFQFNLLFLVFPNGWLGHNGCSDSTYLLIKQGSDTFFALFEYLLFNNAIDFNSPEKPEIYCYDKR